MSQTEALVGLRQPGRYIAQLESLRGWAILLVVVFHAFGISTGQSDYGLSGDSALWLRIIGAGNTGVTLFFVLSGFLLSLPFVDALRNGKHVNVRSYYVARILRIIPLYYTAVLVSWLASGNTISALKAMLFIHVGFDIFPYSVPWWTLSTEMQFYLVLPWLMLALRWSLGRWLLAGALILWFGAHCLYLIDHELLSWPRRFWLDASIFGRGTAFIIGGVCAWLYYSRIFAQIAGAKRLVGAGGIVLLLALLTLLQWYGLRGQIPALKIMPLYHDLEALLWGGLLLCSLILTGPCTRPFINAAMAHFGKISYSLYIVHVPIIFFCVYPVKAAGNNDTPFDTRIILAVAVSFVLSWIAAILCHRLIELPFLKLKAHLPMLSESRQERPASVFQNPVPLRQPDGHSCNSKVPATCEKRLPGS